MKIRGKKEAGSSISTCDYIVKEQIREISPKTVVDFGAGGGKNCKLVRDIMGNSCRIIAVEGYEKAADMLQNNPCCDVVYNELIENWLNNNNNYFDLAIFGDVLEHLKPKMINGILRKALTVFKNIIIIVPLYDIFQDDSYGNPLEVHQSYITPNFFDRFFLKEKHIIVGNKYTQMNVLLISINQKNERAFKRIAQVLFHYCILILQPLGFARPFVNFLKNYFIKYKSIVR